MPRMKKPQFEFTQDVGTNLMNAMTEQMELRSEFMAELQQAPLVRYVFDTVANQRWNFIIGMLKRFAVGLAFFCDDDQDDVWPVAPLYAAPEANDLSYQMFWRTINEPLPREWELIDMDITIYEEGVVGTAIQRYVDAQFYDRKEKRWLGWSCCSGTDPFGLTPANSPPESLDNLVSIVNLTFFPDAWVDLNVGEATPDDMFKFWFKTKVIFEGFQSVAFQLEIKAPEIETYTFTPYQYFEDPQKFNDFVFDPNRPMGVFVFQSKSSPTPKMGFIDENNKEFGIEIFKFPSKLAKRIRDTDWKIFEAPEESSGQLPEEIESQSQIDLGKIETQRIEALNELHARRELVEYTNEELLQDYDILKDYRYKMINEIPQILNSWEFFPGFHMEFYGGNSFYVPDRYSIDPDATLVYQTEFNDFQNLIIRRVTLNTEQRNNTRALTIMQDIATVIAVAGFSTVAGYMAGKYVYLASGGKMLTPGFRGLTMLAATGIQSSSDTMFNFGVEGSDRTWYVYRAALCAAYGKFVDFHYQQARIGNFEGSFEKDYIDTMYYTGMSKQYDHLHGELWDTMMELDVDQNKYANAENITLGGTIQVKLWKGPWPYETSAYPDGMEWMERAALVEIALGNRSWEVRSF